jgi:predicted secreted acid phosphatase
MSDNVITIDGKEYKPEDLDECQKYYLMQINITQQEADNIKVKLDQMTASNMFFKDQLAKSLIKEEAEK